MLPCAVRPLIPSVEKSKSKVFLRTLIASESTTVTISGTNLDLVTSVGFGGGKSGTIQSGGTASSITVSVPVDAQTGTLQLGTAAAKSVTTNNLEMIKPSIASIAPMDIQFTNELTITGTNLDLVTNVKFSGGKEAAPSKVL